MNTKLATTQTRITEWAVIISWLLQIFSFDI